MSETPAPKPPVEPLELQVLQRPGTLAAVVLRIGAGSHDEPSAWPGLAHFLEHLRFLAEGRFQGAQRLMPFVQGCGGRLNASTQARHTDFFFELPAEYLAGGLERLADLLLAPLPAVDVQARERDVLHAEYQARSRDPWTLAQSALAAALAPGHPLAGFHAGDHHSLALEQAAFQQALQDFAASGQRHLLVLGPQAPEQLQALASAAFAELPEARPLARPRPSPLLPLASHSLRLSLPGAPRYWLAFALEHQPEALPEAVEWLRERLRDETPGSLQGWLCEQGLCDSLDLHLTYHHQDQALLVLELALADASADTRARSEGAVLAWLAALRELEPWSRLLQQRPTPAPLAPLEIARQALARQARPATPTPADLGALLAQLQPARLVRLLGEAHSVPARCRVAGFDLALEPTALPAPRRPEVHWRFGQAPAFAALVAPGAVLTGPRWLPSLPGDPQHAALLLRWRHAPARHHPAHYPALQRALRGLRSQAQQQGGDVLLLEQGLDWQLRIHGRSAELPAMLAAALRSVLAPPLAACEQGPRLLQAWRNRQAGELPIRQLLQRLPDVLDPRPASREGPLRPADIPRTLAGSRWDARAIGLDDCALASVQALLDALPGEAVPRGIAPPLAVPGRYWHPQTLGGGEPALLLFCPLPDRSARSEALWHWLARALEPAFYRRMRGELGLGYAVFSGVRSVGGRDGLLFALQTPATPVATALEHVEAFLQQAADHLSDAPALGEALRAQWAAPAADPIDTAWRLHLAGRPADWPAQLGGALQALAPADLHDGLARLLAGEGGWHLLADAPRPGPPWR